MKKIWSRIKEGWDRIPRDLQDDLTLCLVPGLFFCILGIFIDKHWSRLTLALGVIFFSFGYFLPLWIIHSYRARKEIGKFRDDAFVGSSAFSAISRNFHEALSKVSEMRNSKKWLYLKFISFKLANDFKLIGDNKLSIKDHKILSDLLGKMIPECKKRILFTFPYHPRTWVELVYNNECRRIGQDNPDNPCPITNINECPIINNLIEKRDQYLPPHLKNLKTSEVNDIKRIVTANIDDWVKDGQCYLSILALCSEIAGIYTSFVPNNHPISEETKSCLNELTLVDLSPSHLIYNLDTNILDDLCVISTEPFASEKEHHVINIIDIYSDRFNSIIDSMNRAKIATPVWWNNICIEARAKLM